MNIDGTFPKSTPRWSHKGITGEWRTTTGRFNSEEYQEKKIKFDIFEK